MELTKFVLTGLQNILSRNREYFYKQSDQADRVIVWFVGFSIASIALTISNQNALMGISKKLPLIIVIFSCLTIIFGVLYRIFMYFAQCLENQMLISFEGYVEGYCNTPNIHFPRELSGNETLEEMINYINVDFNIEKPIIEEGLNEEEISRRLQLTINFYKSLVDNNNKNLEYQKTEIKNALKSKLGYSDKKVNQIFNPVIPKVDWTKFYWFSLYFSLILFVLTSLIFIAGFIIFMIMYICK